MKALKKELLIIEKNKGKTTEKKIENTFTDELIIGVCSPIGSLRMDVIESITKRLEKDYKYTVEVIKLSDFINIFYNKKVEYISKKTGEFSSLMHKIKGGDYLRKAHNNNSILVELAIKKIREDRKEVKTENIEGRRKCYIIDSLKNIEELKLLRAVYRDIFYLFSVFSLENERKEYLINKELSKSEAEDIINKDEYENLLHGQNVRNTFIEGDFFVRVSKQNKNTIDNRVNKYLHLIMNSSIITPNYSETAMYHAKSSAGNSACLSRQVGATITDVNGTSISRGWNDVPKSGGNLYRESDEDPKRCINLGYCSNVTHRNGIISEIKIELEDLFKNEEKDNLKITGLQNSKINEIIKIIENSNFKNVMEYSRSIHAEMHAIIIGSQMTGDKMVGGSLYCTTYPCHNCARHIVLAGIKNIYYIEPYKKSLCLTLHKDSLTENEDDKDKVRILPYDGVAPRRYLEFFSMNNDSRKQKNGNIVKYNLSKAIPKKRVSLQAIPDLENQAIHSLYECGLIEK